MPDVTRNVGVNATGNAAGLQPVQQGLTSIFDLLNAINTASGKIQTPELTSLSKASAGLNPDAYGRVTLELNKLSGALGVNYQLMTKAEGGMGSFVTTIKELGNYGGAVTAVQNLSKAINENNKVVLQAKAIQKEAEIQAAATRNAQLTSADAQIAAAQAQLELVKQAEDKGRPVYTSSGVRSQASVRDEANASIATAENIKTAANAAYDSDVRLIDATTLLDHTLEQGMVLSEQYQVALVRGAREGAVATQQLEAFARATQAAQAAAKAGFGTGINGQFDTATATRQLQEPGSRFDLSRNAATGISTANISFRDSEGVLQRYKQQFLDTGTAIGSASDQIAGSFKIIGDNSNRAVAGIATLTGTLDALVKAEQQVGRGELSGQLRGLSPETNASRVPVGTPYISGANTEFDTLNNLLKTNYDISIRDEQGVSHLLQSINKLRDLDAATRQLTQFAAAQERVTLASKQAADAVIQATQARDSVPGYTDLTNQRAKLQEEINLLEESRNRGISIVPGENGPQSIDQALVASRQQLGILDQQLATNTDIVAANQRVTDATEQATIAERERLAVLLQEKEALATTLKTAPLQPLPQVNALQSTTGGSKVLAELQKRGLSSDPEEITRQLSAAGAGLRVEQDLVHGLTSVNGAFRDTSGVLKSFKIDFNDAGNIVTRFGGQMSGLSNYLRQTTNDFIKVTQWTVATTILFSGLATVVSSLGLIATFDKQLQALSITAQASAGEIRTLFDQLSQVGISTATPLEELIKSADDMALATKRANQTTKEWRESFLQLANAVGILTNLAGTDTVAATDQLTAIMKQLNLQASDLVGVLDKVTAVAGGQSGAINDIVTGLGAMAQASKEAGLSIDESIATIQVLSQVTSKSAAEVAVSFKNLTGSLGSPAALKVFEKYNIAIKDQATGTLRNILDIYGEISDKIKSGVINESDVQSVLRAISGGPRRLPDAAALLANIGTISAVTNTSLNATNEALVANAKVLDTIPAKVTQLTNAFQAFIQSKFGEVFKGVVDTVVNLAKVVVDFLQLIPANAITAIAQLGLLFLLVKGGRSLLSSAALGGIELAESFGRINLSAAQAALSIDRATLAQKLFNSTANASRNTTQQLSLGLGQVTTPSLASRVTNRLGSPAGLAIAGGIIGGGLAAFQGAPIQQVAGNALQGAGLGLLAVPGAQIAGIAALIGGTLLSLIPQEKKISTAIADQTQEQKDAILTSLDAYRTQQNAIVDLQKTHDDLGKTIDNLISKEQLSTTEVASLTETQKQYADSTLKLVDANAALADGFDNLKKVIPDYQKTLLTAGALDSNKIKDLIRQYTAGVLAAQGIKPPSLDNLSLVPNLSGTGSILGDTGRSNALRTTVPTVEELNKPIIPQFGRDIKDQVDLSIRELQLAGPKFLAATGPLQATLNDGASFDLNLLRTNYSDVSKLFDSTGQHLNSSIVPTVESLGLIDNAITQGGEDTKKYAAAFQDYADKVDAFRAILDQIPVALAAIRGKESLGLLTKDQADLAIGYEETLKRLAARGQEIPNILTTPNGREDRGPTQADLLAANKQRIQGLINQLPIDAKGNALPVPSDIATSVGKEILGPEVVTDLEKRKTLIPTIIALFNQMGYAVTGFSQADRQAAANLGEDSQTIQDNLKTGYESVIADLAQKKLAIQASIQSGTTTPLGAADQVSQINAQTNAATELYTVFNKNAGSLDLLAESLSHVNGLGGIYNTVTKSMVGTGEDWVKQLIAQTSTLGLSGEQIDAFKKNLLDLVDLVENQLPAAQGNLLRAGGDAGDIAAAQGRIVDIQSQIDSAVENINTIQGQGIGTKLGAALAPPIAAAVSDAIIKGVDSANASLASKTIDLQLRLLSGDTDFSQFTFLTEQAKAIADAEKAVSGQLNDLTDNALKQFETQLTGLPGLQDATSLSANDLAARFGALAEKLGLSSEQVKTLIADLLKLQGLKPPGVTDTQGFVPQAPSNRGAIQTLELGNLSQSPGSLRAQNLYRNYLQGISQASEQAFDKLAAPDRTAATKTFLEDLGKGVINDTELYKNMANAIAKANQQLDQQGTIQKLRTSQQSEFADLIKQRSALEADILGLQTQRGQTTDKDEISKINAQIAAKQQEIDQTQALISANDTLTASFTKLSAAFPKTGQGLDELKTGLSKVHGLEFLVNTDTANLIPALIAFAQQMGLTDAQVRVLGDDLVKLAEITTALDGLKATITIEEVTVKTNQQTAGATGQPGAGDITGSPGDKAAAKQLSDDKAARDKLQKDEQTFWDKIGKLFGSGTGSAFGTVPSSGGGAAKTKEDKLSYSITELADDIKKSEQFGLSTRKGDVATIQQYIDKITAQLTPQQRKDVANDRVQLFDGLTKIGTFNTSSEILGKAMKELADVEKKRLDFDSKADQIRRIRVGSGDFSAIANVPFNSANGISVGGAQGPITVNLTLAGQILTPAQLATLANQVGAILKRQIASS